MNSQEFAQHLLDELQPANVITFIRDMVGLGNVNSDELPNNARIHTQDGKLVAMRFKQGLTDSLAVVNGLIAQVFQQ